MIPHLPYHSHTTSPAVQRIPDFEQNPFAIFPPLMIPEPEFFDAGSGEKVFAFLIVHSLLRQPMSEPIQFNGQPCQGAVKIQAIIPHRMLAAELESRESPGPQGLPQLLFLLRLFAA
jgi:hypothetical protein